MKNSIKKVNLGVRINKIIAMSVLLCFLSLSGIAQNQTNISVSSLAEMMQYFDEDNVHVTLATGTYNIGLDDADDDNGDDGLELEPTFFWITGTNSTFDFQNSTITIDTRLFAHYVNYGKYNYGNSPSVDEFHITGTNITVKNLTVEDIGWSAPQRSATGWIVDGENVTLDNITHYARGSYPYGFGDAFGKGGPYQTGLRPLKHGCMVIRGIDITLKNCNIYQYSYGHAIQLIACQGVTIDGCYVEGEMKSTDDMYDGIGIAETEYNAAVAANFVTTWNGEFQLPKGYYMSLAEDGIRTYNTDGWWVGGSIRDGGYKTTDIDNTNDNRRNTENIYVTDTEVRGMRTGFTLYQGGEDKVIDNCRAYDNEVGFVTARSRSITNCYGNAKYGPVFSVVYGEEKIVADITVDDNSAVDGQYQMAYVSGWNHNITLKSSVTPNPNQEITVGGRKYGPRNVLASTGSDSYLDNAYNGVYNNQSGYPMVLTSGAATYNTGTSNAAVTNNNNDNNNISVSITPVTSFTPDPNKAYYIDSPYHNVRLASDGESENPYTTTTNNTSDDTKWRFIQNSNGYWHIQRVAGGSVPRLRTDNTEFADMQSESYDGTYSYYDIGEGFIDNTYFLTLLDGPSDHQRLQIDNEGSVKFVDKFHNKEWESLRFIEADDISSIPTSGTLVHIKKRNATNFAIDGGNGGNNGQNIYLWSSNTNNDNQLWYEIDRGNGYYSYQKYGTDFCIDGNNGGDDGQNVYLWTCSNTNQNQQWKKVSTGSETYRLEKRNAPEFALDGNSGGDDGQNVYLWTIGDNNQNQQWIFSAVKNADLIVEKDEVVVGLYPVPFKDILNVTVSEDIQYGKVEIIDSSGSIKFSQKFSSTSATLDLGSLANGFYIIKITGKDMVYRKSIIKR